MVVEVKMRPFDADHKQEFEEDISNSCIAVYHTSAFAFSSFCHSLCSSGIVHVAMLEVWYWCLQSFYGA